MKVDVQSPVSCALRAWLGLLAAGLTFAVRGADPEIKSLRVVHGVLQVTVSSPAGQHCVTLQSRDHLSAGAWTPRAVQWADTNGDTLTFEIPMDQQAGMVRIVEQTDAELALPPSFFGGSTNFAATTSASAPTSRGLTPGTTTLAGGAAGSGAGGSTAVVESDIWVFDGATLYFYNQNRALQVIDVSRPEAPRLTGWLPLAEYGEQMYLLPSTGPNGETWLALLASPGCSDGNDEVLLVKVTAGQPELAGKLAAPGQIQDSRMVGSVLYLADSSWQTTTLTNGGISYRATASLASFDLTDPAAPVQRSSLVVDGYPQALAVSDGYLLVAGTLYSSTSWPPPNQVSLFDISDPTGLIAGRGAAVTAGAVPNKFSMIVVSNVLATVSSPGYAGGTVFETFSLPATGEPKALASLKLTGGESLYAANFDGRRLYAMTYQTVDPLWIVDWTDAAHPAVAGKIAAPGYATYLRPMGDRLLALGDDGWRTMVEAFDVSDPANPALLSEAVLGDGWSWSEANYDDKAFQVYASANLLLVPWQGEQAGTWFSGVQLIDWDGASLKARGVIQDGAAARRSALLDHWVLALSADDLLSADITNRDLPLVTADLSLTWEADWVRVVGGRLVEVDNSASPAVRLASVDAPRTPLSTLGLTNLPVAGVESHAGLLYVLQESLPAWTNFVTLVTNQVVSVGPISPGGGSTGGAGPLDKTNTVITTNWVSQQLPASGLLSVIAATNDSLALLGQAAFTNAAGGVYGTWSAVWPTEGVMAWSPARQGYFFPVLPVLGGVAGGGVGVDPLFWPYWGGSQLLPFDVSSVAAPMALPALTLATNAYDQAEGGVFGQAGKVFAGRSASYYAPPLATNADGTVSTNASGYGTWRTVHYLDVVDFTDPLHPTVRPPAALPGELTGVAYSGAMVYAVGPDPSEGQGATNYLNAGAYDGVGVSLVASLPIPDVSLDFYPGWFGIEGPIAAIPVHFGAWQAQGPVVTPDGVVWLVRQGMTTNSGPAVEAWSVAGPGSFARLGAAPLGALPTGSHAYGSQLVVAEGSVFEFVDLSHPAAPAPEGRGEYPCALSWSWETADAGAAPVFWVARAASGLWSVPAVGGP